MGSCVLCRSVIAWPVCATVCGSGSERQEQFGLSPLRFGADEGDRAHRPNVRHHTQAPTGWWTADARADCGTRRHTLQQALTYPLHSHGQ